MVGGKLTEALIDEMRESDIPEVLLIASASFSVPWSETSFFNQIRNPKSVSGVARSRNGISGYICASLILDEGHILDIAVHPESRRKGTASALVRHILEHFRQHDCRIVFLEVRASNRDAVSLYERFGFRPFGVRKDYYVSPVEDAVIMHLRLA